MRKFQALLFFATSAIGFGALRPDSLDLLRGLNSPWVTGWALADFDGDNQIDLAKTRVPEGTTDGDMRMR